MSQPAAEHTYDVIVIGVGPVGYTLAARVRAAGLSVAAVERELVGGECSYWACIPSKAMLRPVVAVADARRVGGAAQAVTGTVDALAVFARRDEWVTNWNDEGQAAGLKSLGAELIRGHGILFSELLDLEPLAVAGRATFLFVVAPLPLVGGVGSPVVPVAIL